MKCSLKRYIAGAAGLEPAACGFGDRHSNQLSYAPVNDDRAFGISVC